MNGVLAINALCDRPIFQTIPMTIQTVYAVFLRAIGTLLSCIGAKKWGSALLFKTVQIENRCESLFTGLWIFGNRFLVYSDNHGRAMPENLAEYQKKGYCRGSCYWLIDQFFRNPRIPLEELAKAFEDGAPEDAASIHESGGIPVGIEEVLLWTHRVNDWDQIPRIEKRGVYTILLGFSEEGPTNAHRMALFKLDRTYFFDPIYGLAEWKESEWVPHLQRVGELARTSDGPASFFTVECYRHTKASRVREASFV